MHMYGVATPMFTVVEAACQNSIYRMSDRKPAYIYFTVLCWSVLKHSWQHCSSLYNHWYN